MLMISIGQTGFSHFCWRPATFLVLLAMCLEGCSGKAGRPSLVFGQVTLDGKSVVAGSILLISDRGQAASATLDTTGSYRLYCPPGHYLVAVSPPPPPDPMSPATRKALPEEIPIPKRYQEVSTSGETMEVLAGSNTFDLHLTSKPQSVISSSRTGS